MKPGWLVACANYCGCCMKMGASAPKLGILFRSTSLKKGWPVPRGLYAGMSITGESRRIGSSMPCIICCSCPRPPLTLSLILVDCRGATAEEACFFSLMVESIDFYFLKAILPPLSSSSGSSFFCFCFYSCYFLGFYYDFIYKYNFFNRDWLKY